MKRRVSSPRAVRREKKEEKKIETRDNRSLAIEYSLLPIAKSLLSLFCLVIIINI